MAARGKSVKMGVIGCGWVAETRHLPALQHLPEVEVIAAADTDTERLRQVADRFRIRDRYTDFRALLDDRNIEVVAVCVPPQFHAEVALSALDAGKHLFIEKPLALSLDECDRLIEKAANSSSKVMVGFNLRWHRLVRQAREIVQREDLGRLQLIRTVLTSHHENVPEWRKRRQTGGGALLEMAVHHFDLWRFLLQSEVEEVYAASRSDEWDDETAVVTARMTNGVLAAAALSENTTENNEAEIYGQAGRLQVSCYRFDGLEFFPTSSFPGGPRTRLRKVAQMLKELPQVASRLRYGADYDVSYQTEWRHFINAIKRDTPVECTLEDGRRAVQAMLAALQSASTGRSVKVAQAPRKIVPPASDT